MNKTKIPVILELIFHSKAINNRYVININFTVYPNVMCYEDRIVDQDKENLEEQGPREGVGLCESQF